MPRKKKSESSEGVSGRDDSQRNANARALRLNDFYENALATASFVFSRPVFATSKASCSQ